MGKISKGSWTFEELQAALFNHPNETPLTEQLNERVDQLLKRSLPGDLYPYALEIITVDNFYSKKLALNLITFLIRDKETWELDRDAIVSLRRIRVNDFVRRIKLNSDTLPASDMTTTATIAQIAIGDFDKFGLGKVHFNAATAYLADQCGLPIFKVLDTLNKMHKQGYNVSSALTATATWYFHIKAEYKPKQLELI